MRYGVRANLSGTSRSLCYLMILCKLKRRAYDNSLINMNKPEVRSLVYKQFQTIKPTATALSIQANNKAAAIKYASLSKNQHQEPRRPT
jgi:hypothetical protein